MKKILGIVMASALLWSCGSQFSRSKYDRYQWSRTNGNIENVTEEVKNEPVKVDLKTVQPENGTSTDGMVDPSSTMIKIDMQEETSLDYSIEETGLTSPASDLEFHVIETKNDFCRLPAEDRSTGKGDSQLKYFSSVSELPSNDQFREESFSVWSKLQKKMQERSKKNNSNNPFQGGDANLILLVILSFFIPPLAVYLKDGSATGLFWVTLILCLIGGGGLFGMGYLWSGWGIAILLALLRVFDII